MNGKKFTLIDLAIAIIPGVWMAYVIMELWLWFLVPMGVPAVGILHAYGMRLLWNSIDGVSVADVSSLLNNKEIGGIKINYIVLLMNVMQSTMLLGFGWCIKSFI